MLFSLRKNQWIKKSAGMSGNTNSKKSVVDSHDSYDTAFYLTHCICLSPDPFPRLHRLIPVQPLVFCVYYESIK